MTLLLVVLNVLAFALPAVGFVRLFRSAKNALRAIEAKQKEQGFPQLSRTDRDTQDPAEPLREQTALLRGDIVYVVVGLVCGAAANLIPLIAGLHA